jgi:hypothetical protein
MPENHPYLCNTGLKKRVNKAVTEIFPEGFRAGARRAKQSP